MGLAVNQRENEIKVPIPDLSLLQARLASLHFQVLRPRALESNVVYDTPDGELRARGELIRIRELTGGDATFTFKGPPTITLHKERDEIETAVSNPGNLDIILNRLGLVPRFRYEKYRTEWAIHGENGIVMVDETPVGTYMEIEGPPAWIDRIAAQLGYSPDDYILLSYARLYEQDCRHRGISPSNMTFDSQPVAAGGSV